MKPHDRVIPQINIEISEKFKAYVNAQIDKGLLVEIHDQLDSVISKIIQECEISISRNGTRYLLDRIFLKIQLNKTVKIGDLVIINAFRLDELPYLDLEDLKAIFSQQKNFVDEHALVDAELRRRSEKK